MPAKKKATKKTETTALARGVAVKTDQYDRRDRGVPVRTPDAPAQIAGAESGQSAGTEEN